MLERIVGVAIGAIGVGDARQVDQHLRLDHSEQVGEGGLVTGILRIDGDIRRPEQSLPFVDQAKVEVPVLGAWIGIGERQQIVDAQGVDDEHIRPARRESERQVVADEPGSADQRDLSLVQGGHLISPLQWHP